MPTPDSDNAAPPPSEGRGALERPSHRRRRRLSGAHGGSAADAHPQTLAAGLLAAAVVGSVLAIGALHLPVLVVVSLLSFGAAAVVLERRALGPAGPTLPLPALVFAGLAAYTLVQAIPLPMRALQVIAPAAADIWERCLLPFGEHGPSWASLSLDPGASMVEALKWATYAAVFIAAAAVAARHGAVWGVIMVFGAALAAALTTLGHGLADATMVYGLYQPRFAQTSWHVGPLLNPNNLAGYLNLGALCGLGLMLSEQSVLPRWLLGIGAALIVGTEVTAASRAGVAALALGVVLLAVITRHRYRRQGVARNVSVWLVAMVVVGGAVLAFLGGTFKTWAELYDKDLSKLDMMLWVRPLVRDHPYFGIGRGAFESVFPFYRPEPGNIVYTHAENFVAQWVVEWGPAVALAALGSLAWLFAPRRLGVHRSAIAAGAWCGVIALLAQNLVDLALEVPGVCIAAVAVLGSIWGDARLTGARGGVPPAAPAWKGLGRSGPLAPERARLVAVAVVAAGAALEIGAVTTGAHGIAADRRAAHDLLEASTTRPARSPLRDLLHQAMLRHPAESYFALVGATAAFRARSENPIPWLQRSLERARLNGRAHLLLAQVLASHGARRQALLELKLAAEDDPSVCSTAAELALRWTAQFDEMLGIVPEGKSGSAMLVALCNALWQAHDLPHPAGSSGKPGTAPIPPGADDLAPRCDRETIQRDPGRIEPRVREAQRRIDALSGGATAGICVDRDACRRQILDHADAIAAVASESIVPARLRARLMVADGKPEEAARMLGKTCDHTLERTECLQELAAVAGKVKAPALLDAASRELLGAACTSPVACANTALFLAGIRGERGEAGLALALLGRAAREDPNNEQRWLQLADAASAAGAHAQAIEALEKVARRRGGADPALKQRIDAERAGALGGYLVQPR